MKLVELIPAGPEAGEIAKKKEVTELILRKD